MKHNIKPVRTLLVGAVSFLGVLTVGGDVQAGSSGVEQSFADSPADVSSYWTGSTSRISTDFSAGFVSEPRASRGIPTFERADVEAPRISRSDFEVTRPKAPRFSRPDFGSHRFVAPDASVPVVDAYERPPAISVETSLIVSSSNGETTSTASTTRCTLSGCTTTTVTGGQ